MKNSTARKLPEESLQTFSDIRMLLNAFVKHKASDLHLKAGRPPLFRINGKIVAARSTAVTEESIRNLFQPLMTSRHVDKLENELQVDFSFDTKEFGRFRVNLYTQKGSLASAVRRIPVEVPELEFLGLPMAVRELIMKESGLIIVTGSTGAGKSTSLAGMINYINANKRSHIVSVEDPIEFIHSDLKGTVSQREVGSDVRSMKDAVIAAMRQDPDVIVIGEVRDCDTISAAITAAETGHLVLTTLHTNDARSTIDRIVDVFPAEAKEQIRYQLSSSLLAVISQMLIAKKEGGRVLVSELMVNSPTIATFIRKNQLDKIPEMIATSNTYYNMQTFNQALEQLVNDSIITIDEALNSSNAPEDLRMRIAGFKKEEGY